MSDFTTTPAPSTPVGPEGQTITPTDIRHCFGVSERSTHRWLNSHPDGPLDCYYRGIGYKIYYIDQVIVRLRMKGGRVQGCYGADAAALLDLEAAKRGAPAPPDIYLGADPDRRAGALMEALTDEEAGRWRAVRGTLHTGLIRAVWTDSDRGEIDRLLTLAVIQPAVLRYVIGNNAKESPPFNNVDEWTHWAHLYSLANNEQKAA